MTLVCDGIRQEVQVLRWTQANQLADQSAMIIGRRGEQPGGLQPGFALRLFLRRTFYDRLLRITQLYFTTKCDSKKE